MFFSSLVGDRFVEVNTFMHDFFFHLYNGLLFISIMLILTVFSLYHHLNEKIINRMNLGWVFIFIKFTNFQFLFRAKEIYMYISLLIKRTDIINRSKFSLKICESDENELLFFFESKSILGSK